MAEHKSFESLAQTLSKKYAEKVPQIAIGILRDYSLAALQYVVEATPYKSGRARNNWNTTIGRIDLSYTDGPGPSSGSVSISQGASALAGLSRPDQVVYVANGLPYISRLNNGWSAQAPSGFVQSAGIRARAQLPSIVKRRMAAYGK